MRLKFSSAGFALLLLLVAPGSDESGDAGTVRVSATETLSTQSAEAIARAAQQFGSPQADDITVLTLTRVPA